MQEMSFIGRYKKFKTMNREIKFRGWFQGINGTEMWVYGYLVKQTNGNWEITNGETSWTVDNVGQYTGIKDKNQNEIYEGDVVLYCGSYKGTIAYKDDRCKFMLDIHNSRDIFDLNHIRFKYEVIGNIY